VFGRVVRAFLSAALAAATLASLAAEPAAATFPGRPGKIAFSRSPARSFPSNGDIWIETRSGRQRRLTHTRRVDETDPVFSPNGRLIAYVRRADGNADVWVMRANGTRKRLLIGGSFDELQPSFYPSGRSLLFTNFDGGRRWTAYSIRLNGSRVMRQMANATFPIVSPNGRWLAYSEVGDGGGIRLRDLRTGRTRRLTTGSAQALDFAPDSHRIAFTGTRPCRRGGDHAFAVLSVGVRARRADLVRRSCRREFIMPAWSPNGRKIAFVAKKPARTAAGLRFRLGLMRPDGTPLGGAPRHRRGTNELDPAWQALRR
jgi:Tol biopolymer transport system component